MRTNDSIALHELTAWDQFLATSRPETGYKQSSWWADFMATRGWGSFGAVVNDGDEILGGAKILVDSFAPGKCYFYVPHGPVFPNDNAEEFFEALMEYIDAERAEEPQVVSHVRLEPRWTQQPAFVRDWREANSWLEPRNTLCIDLQLSKDAILEQMKPKGRYNIRLARRKGVSVVEDGSHQGVADFMEIYSETFQRHGLRGHSSQYIQTLMEPLIALDCGTILFAEYEGQRLATVLLVYFGDTATYKYGGSRLAHRNVMAPYLLHFEAILRSKARGHRWYDFYGIAPPDKPDDRWAAFSVFKRKFGGCEQSFIPALDYVYDADAYEAYRRRR